MGLTPEERAELDALNAQAQRGISATAPAALPPMAPAQAPLTQPGVQGPSWHQRVMGNLRDYGTKPLAEYVVRPVVGQVVEALTPPFMRSQASRQGGVFPPLGPIAQAAQSLVPEDPATLAAIYAGGKGRALTKGTKIPGGVLGAAGAGAGVKALEANDPAAGAAEGAAVGGGGYLTGRAGEKVVGGLVRAGQNWFGAYTRRALRALTEEAERIFGQRSMTPAQLKATMGEQGRRLADDVFTQKNASIATWLRGRFGTSDITLPRDAFDKTAALLQPRVMGTPTPTAWIGPQGQIANQPLPLAQEVRLPFEQAVSMLKDLRKLRSLDKPDVLGNQRALAEELERALEEGIMFGLQRTAPAGAGAFNPAGAWRRNNELYAQRRGLQDLYAGSRTNNEMDYHKLGAQLTDEATEAQLRARLGDATYERLIKRLGLGDLNAGLYRAPSLGGVSGAPPMGGSSGRIFLNPGITRLGPRYPGSAPEMPGVGPALTTPPLEWMLRQQGQP